MIYFYCDFRRETVQMSPTGMWPCFHPAVKPAATLAQS